MWPPLVEAVPGCYTRAKLIRRGPMVPAIRDLEDVLLALPRAERARLAERLLASLDDESEVEEAWQAEVRSRLDRFRAGEIEAVSAQSVHDEAQRRLKR